MRCKRALSETITRRDPGAARTRPGNNQMRSVLIIARSLYERYGEFAKFFRRFEEEEDIGVCVWDDRLIPPQNGESLSAWLEESVPGLYDCANRSQYWNAYILNDLYDSYDVMKRDLQNKTQYSLNPYELFCEEKDGLSRKEQFECDPLLNLVWMLGGRDVEESRIRAGENENGGYNDNVKKYTLKVPRPAKIYLITPRIFEGLEIRQERLARDVRSKLKLQIRERVRKAQDGGTPGGTGAEAPDAHGTDISARGASQGAEAEGPAVREESAQAEKVTSASSTYFLKDLESQLQYSTFPERFQYPQNCRFLVFDLPLRSSYHFENAWFFCLLGVYTMMLNKWDNGQIMPLRLYQLRITINQGLLEEFLNRYAASLDALSSAADGTIEDIKEKIRIAQQEEESRPHDEKEPVVVNFPNADFTPFVQDPKFIGIVKEIPEYDESVWSAHNARVKKGTVALFKSIRKGKDSAVRSMKRQFAAELPMLSMQKVSTYDEEEIRDIMDEEELEMVEMNLNYEGSRRQFEESRAEAREIVTQGLRDRIKKVGAIVAVCAAMLIYLAGFIPYIVNSARITAVGTLVAIVTTVVAVILVGLFGLGLLFYRRRKMRKKIERYNASSQKSLNKLTDAAYAQSRYLTDVLDFMKKYQLLKGHKEDPGYWLELELYTYRRKTISEMLAQCRMLAGWNHFTLQEKGLRDSGMVVMDEIKPGYVPAVYDDAIFDCGAFNAERNTIRIPYEFVDEISLRIVQVYQLDIGGRDEKYYDPLHLIDESEEKSEAAAQAAEAENPEAAAQVPEAENPEAAAQAAEAENPEAAAQATEVENSEAAAQVPEVENSEAEAQMSEAENSEAVVQATGETPDTAAEAAPTTAPDAE